ncbi:hypothetical protein [Tateyamaria sp. SN6-1]|uniref:hypothetical protein n=1 Tax=Tateyamaria sp. SN6-1 TaxID=3092148 RepID=UPI0039F6421A
MKENVVALSERGYLLPYKVARHIRVMNGLFSGNRNVKETAEGLIERAEQRGGIHSIILSDEDISIRPDPALLAEFREWFDVKVVFSMRRQDLWLESWYFQNIKWQWNPVLSHCTFDEFMAHQDSFHWIHYDQYVARLEDLFGAENVLLSVFEKQQMPDGPVACFCDMIGLGDISELKRPRHVNSSMSAEMVAFIRHLPLDKFAPPERDLLRVALEQVDRTALGNTEKQSERIMPHDQRRAVLAEYEAGNRALAQRRFGRDTLFMEPLPSEDATLAHLELPQDPAAVLSRFVAPLLEQLVANKTISGDNPKP